MQPPTFTLRPAVPGDAPAVRAVREEAVRGLGPAAYTPGQVRAWAGGDKSVERYAEQIRAGAIAKTVAVEGGTGAVLGWSDYSFDPASATHRIGVYVRPSAARRGVGAALFARAEALAREQGAPEVHCAASLVAVPFYRAMGMETAEEGVHRLPCGTPLPCVHMRKVLR